VAELNARDTKLVQYLNEALTKEKQLEQALQAHIQMTTVPTYRKRLQQHLTETKRHAREVERRVKKLGGTSEGISGVVHDAAGVVQDVAARGAAMAQAPVHLVRGTSEPEVQLKNARTEFKEEAEEIASYTAIQNLAESVGDKDTASLAKAILREEKRMAGFLEKLIPRLTKSVVQTEIPRSERNGGRRRTSSRRTTASRSRAASSRPRTTSARSGTKRSSSARSGAASKPSPRSRSASARSGTSRRTTSSRSSGGATKRRASGSSGRRTAARGSR
jgi:ferritin-like metal-binding protein YciE